MEGLGLPFSVTCQKAYLFQKSVEDFWNVHFSSVMIEYQAVDADVDGFPGFSSNMFALLIYYFEVGDVGIWLVI